MFKYIILFMFFFSSSCFSRTVNLKYVVYAGGFKAFNARIEIIYHKDNTFEINSIAKTTGIFKVLYPATITYKTLGKIEKDDLKTISYEYIVKTRSKERKKSVDISKSSSPDVFVDYQTALLNAMRNISLKNTCDSKDIIFAQNKTLEVIFSETQKELIDKNEYGIFEGNAVSCNIEVNNLAGNDKNDWFFSQSDGKLKAYFAKVFNDNDNDYFLVKSDMGTLGYGLVIAYLESAGWESDAEYH